MWTPGFWPTDEEGTTTVTGLEPLPGIDTRRRLVLVRGDDYSGDRVLVFTAGESELWPELDGAVSLALDIADTVTEIEGTVSEIDDAPAVVVAIAGEDIATAGAGTFDLQHTALDGSITTLAMGSVVILRDASRA